ncbi:MAG: hypothetical protein Q7S02_00355 [bacterium]|nr:hypothetical protein [bacterium]
MALQGLNDSLLGDEDEPKEGDDEKSEGTEGDEDSDDEKDEDA